MGQQNSLQLPVINKAPINFNPKNHQFEGQSVQRVKQTPFVGSIIYSTAPEMIFMEPAQTTLASLVTPRLNTTKLFPEEEIIKIITNVLNGLCEVKRRKFNHYGNLSLQNIFYSKSTKNFKLINPCFNPSTNYLLAKDRIQFTFLAPEELINLNEEGIQETPDFKTDIFVLAICMLQICTLKDSRAIYCPQTYNIFDIQIKERLADVAEYYTQPIASFLQFCLEYQIQKRIDLENAQREAMFLASQGSQQSLQPKEQFQKLSGSQSKRKLLPFGPGHLPKRLP